MAKVSFLPFDVRARNVKLNLPSSDLLTAEGGGWGGGPLYGLYEYVPRDRVDRFLKFLILAKGVIFAPVCIVFPV